MPLWVLYRDPASLMELPLDSLKPGRRILLKSPPDSFDLVQHAPAATLALAAVASRQDRTIGIGMAGPALPYQHHHRGVSPAGCFQWDGGQLIAGSWRDKSATIFETASGRTVVRLPLPLAPRQFCTSGDGGQIFITGDGLDAVVVLFPSTTEIYQTDNRRPHPRGHGGNRQGCDAFLSDGDQSGDRWDHRPGCGELLAGWRWCK